MVYFFLRLHAHYYIISSSSLYSSLNHQHSSSYILLSSTILHFHNKVIHKYILYFVRRSLLITYCTCVVCNAHLNDSWWMNVAWKLLHVFSTAWWKPAYIIHFTVMNMNMLSPIHYFKKYSDVRFLSNYHSGGIQIFYKKAWLNNIYHTIASLFSINYLQHCFDFIFYFIFRWTKIELQKVNFLLIPFHLQCMQD